MHFHTDNIQFFTGLSLHKEKHLWVPDFFCVVNISENDVMKSSN